MQKHITAIWMMALLCACQQNDQHITPPSTSAPSMASAPQMVSEPIAYGASNASAPTMASAPVAASDAADASAVAASAPSDYSKASNKKIFVEHDSELGNKLYLFSGSLKKEGKIVYALTENRFATPQKLPESNKTFQYSLIKEAVDCQKRLTDPVEVTHFSPQDEIVEKHTFPYPDYNTWNELEIKALADEHPNRQFIQTVCQLAK